METPTLDPKYDIIPIFSSHYSTSFSKSILTLDKAEEIKENKPVSICSIAKKHDIKQIFLADSSFSGFQEAYRNITEVGAQLIFGIKIHICDDSADKSDKGRNNDSKLILWARNQAGYKELIKIYSNAATKNFYYYPRIDWSELEKISENIAVWVPFYDSFIFNNLFCHGVSIIPRFGARKVNYCMEEHGLPFDEIVKDGIEGFAGGEIIKTHQVYYYASNNAKSYQVFRAIGNRSTLTKPNLSHFSSNRFSWESYEKSKNGEL